MPISKFILGRLGQGRVTVLVFHKVPAMPDPMAPDEVDLVAFEAILSFLAQHFRILSIDDALKAAATGTLPNRAACITFDDGYADWMGGVVPLLRHFNAPASFFITTRQLLDPAPLWHERVRRCVEMAAKPIPGFARELPVANTAQRIEAVQYLEGHLKYQSLTRREELLGAMETHVGLAPGSLQRISASQIRALHSMGFGIGSHTVEHPILSLCDEARATYEIGASRETLESIICGKVTQIAYPNGRRSDYTAETIAIARHAGYSCGLTTENGAWESGTSEMEIPRFTLWGQERWRMAFHIVRNSLKRR